MDDVSEHPLKKALQGLLQHSSPQALLHLANTIRQLVEVMDAAIETGEKLVAQLERLQKA